jgi:2-methylcitrate dehydratase PrpD
MSTVLLAEKYSAFNYEQLTPNARQKAKECLIDYLGCVYGGYAYDSSKIVRDFALNSYARGTCTLIGSKETLVPAGACLVNGATAHSPELDDMTKKGMGHPGVVVIPTTLAMTEFLGLGGRDFLMATVVGYDVHVKVAAASNPRVLFNRGFHPTAACGIFGAAAAAARLLGLNADQTANALGIAGSFACGNLECYSDGSLTKRIQPGIASSSGVTSAFLAAKGYTGPKSILEGPRGFFHAYSDNCNPEELTRGTGLEIEETCFKSHACCGFNQGAIDAILELCSINKMSPSNIKSILIELTKTAYDIVGQPAEIKLHPKNVVDGQFSAPYSVAIACLEGKAFLEQFSLDSIQRSDVNDLMSKITAKHSPELDAFVPKAFPAKLTVKMNDGAEYVKEVPYSKGDNLNPFSWEELLNKFNTLVPNSMLDQTQRRRIIEVIQNLEELKDITEFTHLLR